MPTLSAPIPKSLGETNDFFVLVINNAPRFEKTQQLVSYPITLEMMLNALRQGVEMTLKRSKAKNAPAFHAQALQFIDAAQDFYSVNKLAEGKENLMHAHNSFLIAANRSPLWNA